MSDQPPNRVPGPVLTSGTTSPAPMEKPTERPRVPTIFENTKIDKIAEAISEVMSNIGTIEKKGFNNFHQYHYARMEDLLGKLTPLMGKAGLMVIQNEVEQHIAENNRLAVTYEFSIAHKSGQVWPEKPRFTGLSMLRDRKGNIDDKALNKCHTSARKYFLLSLFQAPAGDIDDNDGSDGHVASGEIDTVTGEILATAKISPAGALAPPPSRPVQQGPHKIVLGPGMGPDAWIEAFVRAIGAAKTEQEVRSWEALNINIITAINEKFKEQYARLEAILAKRYDDLVGAEERRRETEAAVPGPYDIRADGSLRSFGAPLNPAEMPDPQKDITACINWAAQQLMSLNTLDGLNLFWNQTIAPREQEFFPPDWILLVKEYERHYARLSPEEPKTNPDDYGTQDGDFR